MSPFEAFYERKPALRHLRVFGSKAYVLDNVPHGGKFEVKTHEGQFIGYDNKSRSYVVRMDSGKIRRSQSVRFVEWPVVCATEVPTELQVGDQNSGYQIENEIGGVVPGAPVFTPTIGRVEPIVESAVVDLAESVQSPVGDVPGVPDVVSDGMGSDLAPAESVPGVVSDGGRRVQTVRRSGRKTKRPDFFANSSFSPEDGVECSDSEDVLSSDEVLLDELANMATDPYTYEEAVASSYSKCWKEAMDHEIRAHSENGRGKWSVDLLASEFYLESGSLRPNC
jgi:hypothetical protein